ncbi:hypothetical protein [Deinococcus sp. SL84]|uniref:hypothetical protein n=1 Tax=Deinococcus sp. SL84 TaxID=2994663 RepID=UPI00227538E0|nr:hypothetical protein [Deinococcus sp. SL84]MCY1704289.1 hypothetical protein [Deinococcus sp. SL84]
MYGPIEEVEISCIWDLGQWKMVVTSEGPYKGRYVKCSSSVRRDGVKIRGLVKGAEKIDAALDHCILVNRYGKQDYEAYTLISAGRGG